MQKSGLLPEARHDAVRTAFQAVFGMILTVIIALEFKKSLLVAAEGGDTVVQILSVVMIALLVQWGRSDRRTARRLDRAAELDDDADLTAYNAMLAELARRETPGR